jgi:uncharacterized membrane protein
MVSSASHSWESVFIQKSLVFSGVRTAIRVYQTNTEIYLKDGLQFKLFTTSLSREQEQKLEEYFGN